MSTGVIISRPVEYCTYVYFSAYRFQLLHVAAYIYHIGVGSNVVCSTVSGNAKASESGTDDERFPTLEPVIILYVSDSLCICLVLLTICSLDVPKIKHELKGFPEVHLHAVLI